MGEAAPILPEETPEMKSDFEVSEFKFSSKENRLLLQIGRFAREKLEMLKDKKRSEDIRKLREKCRDQTSFFIGLAQIDEEIRFLVRKAAQGFLDSKEEVEVAEAQQETDEVVYAVSRNNAGGVILFFDENCGEDRPCGEKDPFIGQRLFDNPGLICANGLDVDKRNRDFSAEAMKGLALKVGEATSFENEYLDQAKKGKNEESKVLTAIESLDNSLGVGSKNESKVELLEKFQKISLVLWKTWCKLNNSSLTKDESEALYKKTKIIKNCRRALLLENIKDKIIYERSFEYKISRAINEPIKIN